MGATAAAKSPPRRLSGSDAEVLLSEFLVKAGAWEMRERLDVKALGCHMAVFSSLINCAAFGVLNPIMERIFRQVLVCVYSLDHSTDLPPSIITPGSMLAKAPYFVVAHSLYQETQDLRRQMADILDCDELKLGLHQAQIRHANVQMDFDEAKRNFSVHIRDLQDQLEETERDLSAAREELEFVKNEKDADILRLEGEARQLEKHLMIASNADVMNLSKSENRLLHHASATKGIPVSEEQCQAGVQQGQHAEDLQQQLLDLLGNQIQELNSAYDQLASKPGSMEDVLTTFAMEADMIHQELQKLSTFVPAHDLKEQKDFTKEMPMCLPSELGRHVGAAQRSCGAVAKDCIDGERTLYRNSTDPLWCQIWCHLPPDTVLLRDPHLISRDKVCSFVNAVLSRYMARGIEINSRSTVTQYLLEVLNGQYRHQLAAGVVMQQVFCSLDKLQKNAQIRLYCDVLTGSISAAQWHYIMTISTLVHGLAPAPSLGFDDVSNLLQTIYPDAREEHLHELSHRFRDSSHASNVPGLLCFLIQTIRSGEDPRLPKWQKLIKERDIRAAGGLGKTEFLALVAEELPCVNQAQADMWCSACCKSRGHVMQYDLLLPVIGLFEVQMVLDQAVKAGRVQDLGSRVIPLP